MAVRNRLEVTVLPQNFSKEQQEQARNNISAAAVSATVSKTCLEILTCYW